MFYNPQFIHLAGLWFVIGRIAYLIALISIKGKGVRFTKGKVFAF